MGKILGQYEDHGIRTLGRLEILGIPAFETLQGRENLTATGRAGDLLAFWL